MAERSHPRLRVDERIVRHDGELPEAPADQGEAIRPDDPDPDQAELGVRTADDDGGPDREPRLGGGIGGDRADDGAGLEDLGHDLG